MSTQPSYGYRRTVDGETNDVEQRVRDALAAEGFGVLTEIDIAGAFAKKLGVEFRPYKILGACNPPLAHRALTEEIDIGLLLPCNVVVYAADQPGRTVVAALDPVQQLGVSGRADLSELAGEVKARLERAVDAV